MSTLYPTPVWQQAHKDAYFKQVDGTAKQPVPGFATGRGYPDISAAGSNYLFIVGGEMLGAGGTSVSTPVMAGIITLINAARIRAGKKPVGWITSLLYNYAAKFINDITVGDNRCTALSVCCTQGYFATP